MYLFSTYILMHTSLLAIVYVLFANEGAYTSNCSNAEALAWQGQPGISSHSTSSPAKQTAQQLSPPSKSAALVPAPAVATIHNAGKQASASEHTNRPAGIAAAQAVGMSAVPGHMQQVNRQRQSGLQGRSSLPLQPKQQSMQPAEPDLLHQQKVQAAPGNRESLGGTQGAVTGLTHLALQKHDEAMQLADAANRLSDGVMPSEDTQALGLQVTHPLLADQSQAP